MEPTIPTSTTHYADEDMSNPIPVAKQPGSHPIGAGVGAAMGGAGVGFASGFLGGPIGLAIGTVVGAFAGGLAGTAISEQIEIPSAKPVEMNP